ncbi:MAG: tetratricopeptide repeat protein, partial [Alphaproteobacteria bacterium]|nr:tetratricopeptide repeat protein [Alphaproteobacteria bacterium]
MIKLIFLIIFNFSSLSIANDNLKGYRALENREYKKALYYLSYHANLGDDKAQYNLGIMYKKGLGVPVNHNEAFGWFFLSSNQGNILANYALGHSYYKGSGVKKNYQLALRSFEYAGIRGHPTSRLLIGNMYYNGQ